MVAAHPYLGIQVVVSDRNRDHADGAPGFQVLVAALLNQIKRWCRACQCSEQKVQVGTEAKLGPRNLRYWRESHVSKQ